jgi:hypothetical protein
MDFSYLTQFNWQNISSRVVDTPERFFFVNDTSICVFNSDNQCAYYSRSMVTCAAKATSPCFGSVKYTCNLNGTYIINPGDSSLDIIGNQGCDYYYWGTGYNPRSFETHFKILELNPDTLILESKSPSKSIIGYSSIKKSM